MSKCVILLSGGMDSATLLGLARRQYQEAMALSIDYAQRHKRELESAKQVARHFTVHHEILDITNINHLLQGSALTSDIPVPHGHYEDESMKQTVVPGRNTILLSIAAAWAASMGFDAVAYAAHAGDHAIYPDCRPRYVDAMDSVLRLFHYTPVKLWVPFLNKTKMDILKIGLPLGVPYQLTWTCYDPQAILDGKGVKGSPYVRILACGRCGSCQERLEAFAKIGQKDPVQYVEGNE